MLILKLPSFHGKIQTHTHTHTHCYLLILCFCFNFLCFSNNTLSRNLCKFPGKGVHISTILSYYNTQLSNKLRTSIKFLNHNYKLLKLLFPQYETDNKNTQVTTGQQKQYQLHHLRQYNVIIEFWHLGNSINTYFSQILN